MFRSCLYEVYVRYLYYTKQQKTTVMETLNLNQIIELNRKQSDSILIESLIPYKRSLYTYYKHEFMSEPVLMVVSVSNSAQYALIVPDSDFTDCIVYYLGDNNCMDEDSENFAEYETICFNSILLKNL